MENFQIVEVFCTFGDYILFKISWFFKKKYFRVYLKQIRENIIGVI